MNLQAGNEANELPIDVMNEDTEARELSVDVAVKKVTEDSTDCAAVETSTSPGSSAAVNAVELAATAGEARKRASKKKDVRSTSLSFKDKYDIFQQM